VCLFLRTVTLVAVHIVGILGYDMTLYGDLYENVTLFTRFHVLQELRDRAKSENRLHICILANLRHLNFDGYLLAECLY
jgi:hypothetical protein